MQNQKLPLWQLFLIGSSSIIVIVLAGIGLLSLSGSSIPSISQVASKPINPIAEKLLGQWQIEEQQFIFTPEGKLFIITSSSGNRFAEEAQYNIDTSVQPSHIDITFINSEGKRETRKGIFELTDGSSRLQIPSHEEEQRPTDFTSDAHLWRKVSNATALPVNTEIKRYEIKPIESQEVKAKQAEARTTIAAINRAQSAFYLENSSFSNEIAALELGLSTETKSYRYEIVDASSTKTYATATAKDEQLKSYVGLVLKSSNSLYSVFCESDRPSNRPPAMPGIIGNDIQCPSGYSKRN